MGHTGVVATAHKIADISKTELKIGFVVFADSTAWSTGIHFKQNPSNPRNWIPIDKPSH